MLASPRSALFVGLLTVGACTSSSSQDGSGGACTEIIEHCHPKDDGMDESINSCHGTAHEGVEAECAPIREECIALCDAAPPLGGTDTYTSGGTGSGTGTGTTATTDPSETTGATTGGSGTTSDTGATTGTTVGTGGATGTTGGTGGSAVCDYLAETCANLDAGCAAVGDAGDDAACLANLSDCVPKCGSSACDFVGAFCHDGDVACHDLGHDGTAQQCEDALVDCAEKCG